jgi:hypothetical protein
MYENERLLSIQYTRSAGYPIEDLLVTMSG